MKRKATDMTDIKSLVHSVETVPLDTAVSVKSAERVL